MKINIIKYCLIALVGCIMAEASTAEEVVGLLNRWACKENRIISGVRYAEYGVFANVVKEENPTKGIISINDNNSVMYFRVEKTVDASGKESWSYSVLNGEKKFKPGQFFYGYNNAEEVAGEIMNELIGTRWKFVCEAGFANEKEWKNFGYAVIKELIVPARFSLVELQNHEGKVFTIINAAGGDWYLINRAVTKEELHKMPKRTVGDWDNELYKVEKSPTGFDDEYIRKVLEKEKSVKEEWLKDDGGLVYSNIEARVDTAAILVRDYANELGSEAEESRQKILIWQQGMFASVAHLLTSGPRGQTREWHTKAFNEAFKKVKDALGVQLSSLGVVVPVMG